MHRADSSSLTHILASPWQQRRNAGGGLRGVAIVVALCFAAPVGLAVWSLFCDPARLERVRHGIVASSLVGVGALVVVGWAMLVGNVLRQNHPTMARLVPGHVVRLRAALLVAWAVVVLAAAAGPGFAFDAPLVWACETAVSLAVLTAALRWPVLWAIGLIGPFVAPRLLASHEADRVFAALRATWLREDWLLTAVVLTAGALVMVAVVRGGGSSQDCKHEPNACPHARFSRRPRPPSTLRCSVAQWFTLFCPWRPVFPPRAICLTVAPERGALCHSRTMNGPNAKC